MLPPRPVVITFDDGYRDVVTHALPIMQRYGFCGVAYVIAGQIGTGKYMKAGELRELFDAGWEIGSHSMSHVDLTLDYSVVRFEMLQSRLTLQEASGESIDTYAYAYGKTDGFITGKVNDYGYRAAMGLGSSWEHTLGTLLYLSRIEVQGDYNLSTFAVKLPWSDH